VNTGNVAAIATTCIPPFWHCSLWHSTRVAEDGSIFRPLKETLVGFCDTGVAKQEDDEVRGNASVDAIDTTRIQ